MCDTDKEDQYAVQYKRHPSVAPVALSVLQRDERQLRLGENFSLHDRGPDIIVQVIRGMRPRLTGPSVRERIIVKLVFDVKSNPGLILHCTLISTWYVVE